MTTVPTITTPDTALAVARDTVAASTGEGGVWGGVTLMAVGLLVVFSALVVLMVVIRVLYGAFADRAAADAAAAPSPAPRTVPTRTASDGSPNASDPTMTHQPRSQAPDTSAVPAHVLAVIAAAAAAAVGGRVRVKRVFQLHDDHRAWISGGRSEIMQSHLTRRVR